MICMILSPNYDSGFQLLTRHEFIFCLYNNLFHMIKKVQLKHKCTLILECLQMFFVINKLMTIYFNLKFSAAGMKGNS